MCLSLLHYADWSDKHLTSFCSLLGYKCFQYKTAMHSFCCAANVIAARVDLMTVNSNDPDEMVQTLIALSSGPLAFPLLFSKPLQSQSHEGYTRFLFCCVQAPNYLIMPCNTTITVHTAFKVLPYQRGDHFFIGLGLLPERGHIYSKLNLYCIFSTFLCKLQCIENRNCTVQTTHQESRGAVQEASDSGKEASVEKAGELGRNPPGLRRMEEAAHYKLLTWMGIEKDGGDFNLKGSKYTYKSCIYFRIYLMIHGSV